MCIFVSEYLSVCLFPCLSTYASLSLSLSPFIFLFISLAFLSVYLFISSLSLSLSLTFLFYFPSVALSPSPSLPPAFSSVIPSAVSSSSPPLCLSLFCLTNYLYVCICYLPSPRHLHKKKTVMVPHILKTLFTHLPPYLRVMTYIIQQNNFFALYFHIDSR